MSRTAPLCILHTSHPIGFISAFNKIYSRFMCLLRRSVVCYLGRIWTMFLAESWDWKKLITTFVHCVHRVSLFFFLWTAKCSMISLYIFIEYGKIMFCINVIKTRNRPDLTCKFNFLLFARKYCRSGVNELKCVIRVICQKSMSIFNTFECIEGDILYFFLYVNRSR